MKPANVELMKSVMTNQMLESKKLFEKLIAERVASKVSVMRQRVAKEFFNKK